MLLKTQQDLTSSLSKSSSSSSSSSSSTALPQSSALYKELLDALARPLGGQGRALVFLAGAKLGLFYETLAFMAILTIENKNNKSGDRSKDDDDDNVSTSSSSDSPIGDENPATTTTTNGLKNFSKLLTNLSAFMYWDYFFNYYWKLLNVKSAFRRYTLARRRNDDDQTNLTDWTSEIEKAHVTWCKGAGIDATAVKKASDIIEDCIRIVFKVRFASVAEWLQSNKPFPLWKRSVFWRGELNRGESNESRRDNMLSRVYGEDGSRQLCHALCALLENEGETEAALMYALEVTEDKWKACEIVTEQKRPSINKLTEIQNKVKNTKIGTRIGKVGRKVQSWNKNRKERRLFRINAVKGYETNGEFQFDVMNEEYLGEGEAEDDNNIDYSEEFQSIAPIIYSLHLGSTGDGFNWCRNNASSLMVIGNRLEWIDELFARGNAPRIVVTKNKEYEIPLVGARDYDEKGVGRRNKAETLIFRNVWPAEVHNHYDLQSLCMMQEFKFVVWRVPESLAQGGKQSLIKVFLSLSALLDQIEAVLLESSDDAYQGIKSIQLGLWLNGDNFSDWSVLPAAYLSGWNLVGWSLFDSSSSIIPEQKKTDNQQHFYVFQYDTSYND